MEDYSKLAKMKKKMKQNAKKPMKTFDGNLSWDLFLDGQN